MSTKTKDGITVTVYAIRKGVLYLADQSGQKYKIKRTAFPFPVHVGAVFTNVKWS